VRRSWYRGEKICSKAHRKIILQKF
jgi:hypothetical protein